MMSNRDELIARKHEIRQRIQRLQRQLEQEPAVQRDSFRWVETIARFLPGFTEGRLQQRRTNKLEVEIEQLMAQEYSLRLAIDKSR